MHPAFNEFVQGITPSDYADKVIAWINKTEYDLRLFAFKIFDVHRDPVTEKISSKDKITQESLFTFMEFFKKPSVPLFSVSRELGSMVTGSKKPLHDTDILTLEQIETDIFFEKFSKDFGKISKALIEKINKKQREKDEQKAFALKPENMAGRTSQMSGGSGAKPVIEKKSFKSMMKEEEKSEPESLSEAEFNALYKVGEMPAFVDDLV